MKSKNVRFLFFVTLMIYWVGLCDASAFYDPGAQRWLNRDPISNDGFQTLKNGDSNLLNDDAHSNINLFGYINNNGIDNSDDFGLLCVKSSINLIDYNWVAGPWYKRAAIRALIYHQFPINLGPFGSCCGACDLLYTDTTNLTVPYEPSSGVLIVMFLKAVTTFFSCH